VEYVDKLAGSQGAKQRLKLVLATLSGERRVQDVCRELGLSEPRFHQLREELLSAALARAEPQPAGRKPRPTGPEHERLVELTEQLAAQEVELQAARARAEIALILPGRTAAATPEAPPPTPPEAAAPPVAAGPAGEKKIRRPKRRRRR
jgi:hypothetical protein